YDDKLDVLIVEVVQSIHIRFVPFKPVPGRLIVRLLLQREGGKHYIHHQEDYIHPNVGVPSTTLCFDLTC
ncbi:hypothetical protein SERLA73DRAFT_92914, partial [Serpula lacrymans var. lacrymans S7.3]